MATDVKQNLSLGKLRRAVDGNNSYTNAMSMSQASGSSATSPAPVKMSDFSISAINEGGLFNKRIANRTENLSWSFDGNLDVTFVLWMLPYK